MVSHSFCQHSLSTARWAIHEHSSGWVNTNLRTEAECERTTKTATHPQALTCIYSPVYRAQNVWGGAPQPPSLPVSGCPSLRCRSTSHLASDLGSNREETLKVTIQKLMQEFLRNKVQSRPLIQDKQRIPAVSIMMLLSASGGRTSTRALLCLCRATEALGFSSSLSIVLKIRT